MKISPEGNKTAEVLKRYMKMNKNGKGYPDPTAGAAWSSIRRKERQQEAERLLAMRSLIPIMIQMAELAGFEVVGRITLKDKRTGKEYR